MRVRQLLRGGARPNEAVVPLPERSLREGFRVELQLPNNDQADWFEAVPIEHIFAKLEPQQNCERELSVTVRARGVPTGAESEDRAATDPSAGRASSFGCLPRRAS